MRKSLVWIVLAGCLLFAPLQATVLVPATLEELSREAHTIVRGRVVATDAIATGDWRSIETVVTLATEGALKGSVGSAVQFRMPGGQVGRYRRVVLGAPELRVGQRVIVFLTDRRADLPYVIGLGQGVFRLVQRSDGWVVTPPVADAVANLPQAVVRGDGSRRLLPLADFEREVRALIGAAR